MQIDLKPQRESEPKKAKNKPMKVSLSYSLLTLCAVLIAVFIHWLTTKRSSDPFISTKRVTSLKWLILCNAVGLVASGLPQEPKLTTSAILIVLTYTLVLIRVHKQAHLIRAIEQEYFSYSLPSKRSNAEFNLRHGRLQKKDVALYLQLFVKEGLQFQRLAKTSFFLVLQGWLGLIIFIIFGLQNSELFAISLLSTIITSESAASIATRATLHPGHHIQLPYAEDTLKSNTPPCAPQSEAEHLRPRRRLPSVHPQ